MLKLPSLCNHVWKVQKKDICPQQAQYKQIETNGQERPYTIFWEILITYECQKCGNERVMKVFNP